jgi:tRNA-modifying protein YgfZ
MNGYQALREAAASVDLSSRGKIRVTGEDRARLLHALSTNHIRGLQPGQGLYAFFLNEKGRILADTCIYHLADALFLDTEPETRQKLFEQVDRFIIADDVTLEDQTESLAAIGLEGPKSLEIASRLEIPAGNEKFSVKQFGSGLTARVTSTGAEGLRIFVPVSQKESLLDQLQAAGAVHADSADARLVRLEHAVPRYGEEISDRYLIQETQMLDAVHWNKGCYLGQEIVERVRSRGQVHRLLTPVRIVTNDPPAAGVKLIANGSEAGEVASTAFSPTVNEVVGFAYLRTEAAQSKPEMVVAGSAPPIPAFVR